MILEMIKRPEPGVFVGHQGNSGFLGHQPVHFGVAEVQGLIRPDLEMLEDFLEALGVWFGPADIVTAHRQIEKAGQAQGLEDQGQASAPVGGDGGR